LRQVAQEVNALFLSKMCNGQELVEPQSARRTPRIKEKNFALFASFAVKFCSKNT
jgi:hypothetical protein